MSVKSTFKPWRTVRLNYLVCKNIPLHRVLFLDKNESSEAYGVFRKMSPEEKDVNCSLRLTLWKQNNKENPDDHMAVQALANHFENLIVGKMYDVNHITGLHFFHQNSPRANAIHLKMILTTGPNARTMDAAVSDTPRDENNSGVEERKNGDDDDEMDDTYDPRYAEMYEDEYNKKESADPKPTGRSNAKRQKKK